MRIDELRLYLTENQQRCEKEDPIHRGVVNQIASDLSLLGIHQTTKTFREVALFEEGREIGRVDIVALAENEVYLIEGKVARVRQNGKQFRDLRREINQQLEKSYNFFLKNFKVSATCIGVYKKSPGAKLEHYLKRRPVEDILLSLGM